MINDHSCPGLVLATIGLNSMTVITIRKKGPAINQEHHVIWYTN